MLFRLLVLFTVVPLVELAILVQLGRLMGLGPTVALVLVTGAAGAWLARWQGIAVLRRVQADLAEGRMPAGALLDGALILAAGALLLTPGLLTDLVGLSLLVPPLRRLLRRRLGDALRRRMQAGGARVIDVEPL